MRRNLQSCFISFVTEKKGNAMKMDAFEHYNTTHTLYILLSRDGDISYQSSFSGICLIYITLKYRPLLNHF